MKIKPIYILNFVFIILIIALLFTPLRSLLEKIQSTNAQSEFSTIKSLTPEQYDIELKGINTDDINFKDFKGKKIFLNFWGTWCPICVEEMPDIQKLYDKKKNEYQFVLIYMKDEKAKVQRFLEENQYTFPVYEAVSPIETALLPRAFPTTILIDEKGIVKGKTEGAVDWKNLNFY
ncbi:MAG: TlpA family protein disulfide reductase [Flavobacteriaceae bacterium]|jgi:thiol-disulfide isomerase/thioredoxin|nr:TlpA family protein disulfide reductase [Flavobacteriaceae bacterium]